MFNAARLKFILSLLAAVILFSLNNGCNKGKVDDETITPPPPPEEEPELTIYEKMAGTYKGVWKKDKSVSTSSGTTHTLTTTDATIKVYFTADSTDLIYTTNGVGLSWFDDSTMVEGLVYYLTFNTTDGSEAWFHYDKDSLIMSNWQSYPNDGIEFKSTFRGKKQ